jgi:hypothetical protein
MSIVAAGLVSRHHMVVMICWTMGQDRPRVVTSSRHDVSSSRDVAADAAGLRVVAAARSSTNRAALAAVSATMLAAARAALRL